MDPTYSAEAEAYREKIQAFLAEHLPAGWQGIGALPRAEAEQFASDWRRSRCTSTACWPRRWPRRVRRRRAERARAGDPGRGVLPGRRATVGTGNDVFGIQMVGNTILQWGTEEQKAHFLPAHPVGRGHLVPGLLRAQRRLRPGQPRAAGPCSTATSGCINGQKIWTSAGHLANWIFVLARTDPDAPKHKGISFLLVPMDQPGVEVRPIQMITGETEFNEVFFTDARCPKDNVVGEVNNGWAVAMTLLGYERGEAAATFPIMFRTELDRLLALAAAVGPRRRPADPPAPGLVLLQGARSCATSACAR